MNDIVLSMWIIMKRAGGRQACQKFLKTGMPDAVFIINPDALTGFFECAVRKTYFCAGSVENNNIWG